MGGLTVSIYPLLKKRVLILYCNLRPYFLFIHTTRICGRKINKNEDEQLRNGEEKSESTHRQISG